MNEIIVTENYKRAVALTERIRFDIDSAYTSIMDICKCLKEIHEDKLYEELGYQSLEEYTEKNFNIKQRQAYKYLSIAQNLPEDFLHSSAKIGVTKLEILSRLTADEREEIMQTVDVENESVKKLKEEIASLKSQLDYAEREADGFMNERDVYKNFSDNYKAKAERLENELKELRNAPIDVTVADNSEEIEKLQAELDDVYKQLEAAKNQDSGEVEKLKTQLKDAKKKVDDARYFATEKAEKEVFSAHMETLNNVFDGIFDFLLDCSNSNKEKFFKQFIKELDSQKKMFKDGVIDDE